MRIVARVMASITAALSVAAAAGTVVSSGPERPDPSGKYLFYMHGRGVDEGSSRGEGPYGRTVQALSELGVTVISEIRPGGAKWKFPDDHERYALKVAQEVDGLLKAGVPAGNIIVSGYSRGGTLALIVSSLIGNPDLNFIVMAGCIADDGSYQKALPIIHERYAPKLKGHFLSLRDSGDADFGSCKGQFGKASGPLDFKEITLSTGKGHSAFQEPAKDWLQPIAEWIRRR